MKKPLSNLLLCTALCTVLILSAFASDKTQCCHYDYDKNGTVELVDVISALKAMLNESDSDVNLARVLNIIQGAVASTKVAATINSIDTSAGTATVSTEYLESFTVPLSMLGIGDDASEADYNGVPAVLSVHAPLSKFFTNYENDGKGVYCVTANEKYTGTPQNAVATLNSVSELNTNATDGSHLKDDYNTAYLETNFREKVTLSSSATTTDTNYRYDNSWYPRIKKVNDNLYLLLWMYGQFGQHIYYATSSDGVTWNAPEVLWNSKNYPFTYEGGSLDGEEDYLHAMNADACVLDDGSVLCVFAVRAPKGYRYYPDLCGLYTVRGTVNGSTLTWGNPVKVYTGQVWEPSMLQRTDGEIHIYFTQVAPDIVQYGYDEDHRSSETGLIISTDSGETWTPSVEEGDTNYYRALTIYREYVGDKDGRPHYNGQMPVGVQLATGKILLAVEIKDLNGKFRISYATSNAGGNWTNLGANEEGKYTKLTVSPNSSPYVDRFPSGEVYMTHNYGATLVGRLGAPDGSEFGKAIECAPDCIGIWGACATVGSHKMATVMQNEVTTTDSDGKEVSANEIHLYYSYLNHRISAKEISVVLDGYTNEWVNNTDALFVGSDTQAQTTVQAAHDKDNVYFLVSRLDKYLTNNDSTVLYIADGDTSYYTVTFKVDGTYTVTHTSGTTVTTIKTNGSSAVKRYGTIGINTNIDTGLFIEFAVPKSEVGLEGASSFKAVPALINKDVSSTVTEDTLTNVDMTSTENWIEVVLQD